ncbi:MAG: hypothetical protein ACRDOU_33685 [Streptosporangiaceae bacterium]
MNVPVSVRRVAWHAGYREMPYVLAGSAASAAGGFGLLATRPADAEPARNLAVLGAAVELIAKRQLIRRLAGSREPGSAEPESDGPIAERPRPRRNELVPAGPRRHPGVLPSST